jgi:hypothetical protein
VTLPRNILYYGSAAPLPEPVRLRAGALSLSFVSGEIRNIQLGSREILQRVYVTVRDRNWRTVPSVLLDVKKTIAAESFEVYFEVENKKDEIDFYWRGSIVGQRNGTILFALEGTARSTFWQNRIGFCVLHSSSEWAGSCCSVETITGKRVDGEFPLLVSPEAVFSEIRAISYEILPDVQAEVRLEGDTYEMEDQRNWSDASYKTYCPPLRFPFPSEIRAGSTFSQSVTLTIRGDTSHIGRYAADGPPVVALCEKTFSFPRVGLGTSSGKETLSPRSIDRLRALHLSHLRVDLKLGDDGYETQLRRAADEASSLGAVLEVALFLTDDAQREIEVLRAVLNRIRPQVDTWLVFHVSEKSTCQKWLDVARYGLSDYNPAARFGGGTDAYFAELNRFRPPATGIDVVSYPINPQVHLSDNASLIENLQAQRPMVESARQFTRGVRLAVSPITLKPRSNPDATSIEGPVADGELPLHVDPRQMSLLGAVWTMGSLRNLTEAGIYSTTYYETIGWGGVMETEQGPLLPARFPSLAGSVFPLYHLFADVGEFQGGKAVLCTSSDPLKVHGLALSKNGGLRIILANVTSENQTIRLLLGARTGAFQVKLLDEQTAEFAMRSPEAFRAAPGKPLQAGMHGAELDLLPYAVARLDLV